MVTKGRKREEDERQLRGITNILDRAGINKLAKSLRRKVGEQEKHGIIEVKREEIPQEDRDEDFSGSPVVKTWVPLL